MTTFDWLSAMWSTSTGAVQPTYEDMQDAYLSFSATHRNFSSNPYPIYHMHLIHFDSPGYK